MAWTIGNTTPSGDKGSGTSYSFSHTINPGSNLLVVTTYARDTDVDDIYVSGVTYGGTALTRAVRTVFNPARDLATEIWYLVLTTQSGALTVEVTHTDKVSDFAGVATDSHGVDTNDPLDKTENLSTTTGGNSTIVEAYPTATDAMGFGAMVIATGSVGDFAAVNGTSLDETDMGSYCGATSYLLESSNTCLVKWSNSAGDDAQLVLATFNLGTQYATLGGARILNSSRVDQSGADNVDVSSWVKTNDFIIALNINSGGVETVAAQYKLRWRALPSGSFADVASTGAIKFGSTDLVNGNAVVVGERACDSQGGDTWQDGEEVEGTALCDSIDLADEYETEIHFSLSPADAVAGVEYEFELYNNAEGASSGTLGCTLTILSDSGGSAIIPLINGGLLNRGLLGGLLS